MVEAQQSAESLDALECIISRLRSLIRLDQSIVDPLMIPLAVIMSGVLASGLSKRPFAEEDHSIEALILDRSDESFGYRWTATPGRIARETRRS